MPVKDKIQGVTVVPTLAPITTGMPWESCMMPELTKPTTMTVVAEELWMTAVTAAPKATALKGCRVRFSRIGRRRRPARFSSDSPMICIPYKNMANPPSSWNTSYTLIHFLRCRFKLFPILHHRQDNEKGK